MIQWHYPVHVNPPADKNYIENPGEITVWDFYESPYPWGPWTKFHSKTFNPEGYYNPCIVSKFIYDGGKKFIIFTNGNHMSIKHLHDDHRFIYRLHTIECELIIE
jgi:hypothetical protein